MEERRDAERDILDELLDEALEETFPASDPIAVSRARGPGDSDFTEVRSPAADR